MAAAYTDWLIAANGIALHLAANCSGIRLLLLLLLLSCSRRLRTNPLLLALRRSPTRLPSQAQAKRMADRAPYIRGGLSENTSP